MSKPATRIKAFALGIIVCGQPCKVDLPKSIRSFRREKREIDLGANLFVYCLKSGVGARSVSLRAIPCRVGNFSKADLTISSEVLACQSATMSNWPGVVHASMRPGKLLSWLTNVWNGVVTLKRLMPSGIWFWK